MTLDARSAQRAPGECVDVITRVHSDPAIVGTLGAGAAVVMVEASAAARRVVATGIVATTIYSSDCSATRSVQRPGSALGAVGGFCRAGVWGRQGRTLTSKVGINA